jgi:hypothetical protein
MELPKVSITLNIQNNRSYSQQINVLGSPVNPLDTANALTEYLWNITAYTPSASDTLALQYKPVGAASFSIFTYQLINPNIQSVVSALNTLGIGYFQTYTQSGSTYIVTNNDNYVFGNLIIDPNASPIANLSILFVSPVANTYDDVNVNNVTPTLVSGTNVPYSSGTHTYNTDQTGTNQTLNILIGTYVSENCIELVDSAGNTFRQQVNESGYITFNGLTINNVVPVQVRVTDGICI